MGVFLDGLDPEKVIYQPSCRSFFSPPEIEYKWDLDEKGRRVPLAVYKNEVYFINNLHIASKRLERFTSKEWPL